jgi:hypothetical protein
VERGARLITASTSAYEVAQLVAAAGGGGVAGLVAAMPFARRPRVSLAEDRERIQSRIEETPRGAAPYVRLIAKNAKWRRTATVRECLSRATVP